jgi:hypothetical protein
MTDVVRSGIFEIWATGAFGRRGAWAERLWENVKPGTTEEEAWERLDRVAGLNGGSFSLRETVTKQVPIMTDDTEDGSETYITGYQTVTERITLDRARPKAPPPTAAEVEGLRDAIGATVEAEDTPLGALPSHLIAPVPPFKSLFDEQMEELGISESSKTATDDGMWPPGPDDPIHPDLAEAAALPQVQFGDDADEEPGPVLVIDLQSRPAPEDARSAPFVPPRMMPGQEPYTEAETAQLYALVEDAANGDPGERDEHTARIPPPFLIPPPNDLGWDIDIPATMEAAMGRTADEERAVREGHYTYAVPEPHPELDTDIPAMTEAVKQWAADGEQESNYTHAVPEPDPYNPGTTFDAAAGRAGRDEGTGRTAASDAEEMEKIKEVLRSVASAKQLFTADDVYRVLIERGMEVNGKRVGAAFLSLSRCKPPVIVKQNGLPPANSKRVTNNARPLAFWSKA